MLEIQSSKIVLTLVDTETGELFTKEATFGDSDQFIFKKVPRESNGRWKQSNTEEFIKKAKQIHGNKYNYSKVEYKNSSTKVCIICPKHGEFWQRPNDHISKKAECPLCKGKFKYTKESFAEKSNKIHNNKYNYSLVNYIDNKTHVNIICPIHGVFSQRPDKHLRGQGCPKCNHSHGENEVERILISKNIEYYSQYIINIDKSINPSGYAYIDFYLPKYNLFIEYNGEQHYINRIHFGGKILDFKRQQKRDEFVRNYCKNNNIRLLEIPYTEKNIKEVINNYLIND